jgi:hypothetical protein
MGNNWADSSVWNLKMYLFPGKSVFMVSDTAAGDVRAVPHKKYGSRQDLTLQDSIWNCEIQEVKKLVNREQTTVLGILGSR